MHVAPGTRFGPYEIVSPLGAGGMGEVWRARDTRLDRSVALKVLPDRFRHDAQLRARFDREAKAISQLNHPHICTLHDVGDDYLVMELLEGETLADRLGRGPLSVADVIRFGSQMAEALDAAHRRGIVHRDLKPGNVMITRSGAKLLDFGLARTDSGIHVGQEDVTQQRPLTAEGTILGTLQYMAPEQLEGEQVDPRADIFALGAVIYEMATGRRAFEGKSRTSLIAAIVAAEPRPMREAQPLAPAALEQVVSRCLRKDPADRWQSAADVHHALQLVSESEPRATALAPGRRWIVPALIASLLIVLSLAAYLLATRARPREERVFRASILPPAAEEFPEDINDSLSISPDAKWMTFRLLSKDTRLWVRRIDSGESKPLPGTENAFLPMWSPDSREIAFFNNDKLKRVSLEGTPPQTICPAGNKARRGAWSTGGEIVFAPDSLGALSRVSAAGGTPVPLTRLGSGETTHRWASFLPDQRHFLYFAGNHESPLDSEKNAVYVSSLDEPSKRTLVVRARSNAVYASGHILYALGTVLVAQPFDVKTLEVTGKPFPVVNNIEDEAGSFLATFAVADDGTLVYRSSPDVSRRELMWLGPNGTRDGTRLGEPAALVGVRLSPDGRRAALTIVDRDSGLTDIWIQDLTTQQRTRITNTPDANEWGPAWSPDGKQIAFARSRAFGTNVKAFVMSADGADVRPLAQSSEGEAPTDWLPDGAAILGFSWPPNNQRARQVTLWNVRDGRARPVVPGIRPRMSPDGKWFLYGATEGAETSVWIARLPDGSQRRRVSRASGSPMFWAADKAFYSSEGQMHVATIDMADGTVRSDVLRFGGTDWIPVADSRDGDHLIGIVQPEDAADHAITLVSNFLAGAPR